MKQRVMFVILMVAAGMMVLAAFTSRPDAPSDLVTTIELPERTPKPAPVAPELPLLPANAEAIEPVTMTVTTIWRGPNGQRRQARQHVTRTVDRVRLVLDGTREEWLFERNAVDPRRVSAFLVDHGSRQIVEHPESSLRAGQRLRGWADVVMMRFEPRTLKELQPTGETRVAGGVTFSRYTASDRQRQGILDVWWSDALLVPLRLTSREGEWLVTSAMERFDERIDPETLKDPRIRFPEYKVLDIADAHEFRQ